MRDELTRVMTLQAKRRMLWSRIGRLSRRGWPGDGWRVGRAYRALARVEAKLRWPAR